MAYRTLPDLARSILYYYYNNTLPILYYSCVIEHIFTRTIRYCTLYIVNLHKYFCRIDFERFTCSICVRTFFLWSGQFFLEKQHVHYIVQNYTGSSLAYQSSAGRPTNILHTIYVVVLSSRTKTELNPNNINLLTSV